MTDTIAEERSQWKAALEWRKRKGLTRSQLAVMIGYTTGRIQDFEAGYSRGSGEPIGAGAWKRYRLACAAVDRAGLEFNWGQS